MLAPRSRRLSLLTAALAALAVVATVPQVASAQPPPPRIDEAEVRTFLASWLATQNRGDFAAYQAHYAARFFGVRRSGATTAAFDRAGWMKDRGDMFRRAMTVEASGLQTEGLATTAVLRFTQTWASGGYKDVGPKQLVLVREGGALKIAREEMLASRVVGAATAAAQVPRDRFAFVAEAGGGSYVILADGEADWAVGEPELLGSAHAFAARARVDTSKLTEALVGWQGREVTVFDGVGGPCRARVTGLWLLSRFEPHFGQSNQWLGQGDFEGEPPASPAEIARQGFGNGATVVVGALDGCKGVWARAEGRATPPSRMTPDAAVQRQALAAFRKLPGYKAIQKDFKGNGHTGAWDAFDGAAPRVVAFGAKDEASLVAVSARAGHGCGDFYGEFWAVWEVRRERGAVKLVLQTDVKAPGALFEPVAAADVDGDGDVELMSGSVLMSRVDGVYRVVEDRTPPDFDCPC